MILRVFAGIVSVVSLTLIPYVLTNHASYFWKGMIGIHLNSMKAHEGFHFEFGKKQILILFISFLFMWLSRQSINKNVNEGLTSQSTYAFFKGASLLFVGTCISIALDQPNFAHHLLQIIPFPLLFIWLYLTESKPKIIWKSLLAWPLAVIMLITSTYLVYKKSDLIEKNYVREAAIEKCVESVVPPASKIWALNSIYLYWRENYVPASPLLIHPSTLLMPNFLQTFPKHPLSQSEALMSIIKSELDFVIRSKGPTYLTADLNLELNRELDEKFTENFACKHLRIEIYKRNSN